MRPIPIFVPVILRAFVPVILRPLGVQNLFCSPFFVPNLFCGLECMLFCGPFFVPNLFCWLVAVKRMVLTFIFICPVHRCVPLQLTRKITCIPSRKITCIPSRKITCIPTSSWSIFVPVILLLLYFQTTDYWHRFDFSIKPAGIFVPSSTVRHKWGNLKGSANSGLIRNSRVTM